MTTILSTPTTVSVTVPGDSALGRLAASMSPGQWSDFTMGGMNTSLVDAGGGYSIIAFCARGHWDPVHKKAQFWGKGHISADKLITWDDVTNQWSIGVGPDTGQWGHSYYHHALDKATGDMFYRSYASGNVQKKPYGGAWSYVTPFNNGYSNQVAGGLTWFPELNTGTGGLVWIDVLSCQTSNSAISSWTTRSATLSGLGNYHNWAAHSGAGYVYFGGGDGSSTMYRLSSSGAITSAPNTPMNAGIWANGGNAPVITHPDGSQLLLFAPGETGAIYRFNGTSWVSHGTHSIGGGGCWFAIPISDYGVVVFVSQWISNVGPVTCRVYKP